MNNTNSSAPEMSRNETILTIESLVQNSISSESDLSLSIDPELNAAYSNLMDELPAFEIRLLSPSGRTPSPIDNVAFQSKKFSTKILAGDNQLQGCDTDLVLVKEIDALIKPLNDVSNSSPHASNLETIFEGVFLNTPPRNGSSSLIRRNSSKENSNGRKIFAASMKREK